MILLWNSLFSSTRLIFLKYHFPHMQKSFSNFFWLSKLIQISQPGNLGYSMVVQFFQTKIFCSSWNPHFSPNLHSYSCLEHFNHREFQRKFLLQAPLPPPQLISLPPICADLSHFTPPETLSDSLVDPSQVWLEEVNTASSQNFQQSIFPPEAKKGTIRLIWVDKCDVLWMASSIFKYLNTLSEFRSLIISVWVK